MMVAVSAFLMAAVACCTQGVHSLETCTNTGSYPPDKFAEEMLVGSWYGMNSSDIVDAHTCWYFNISDTGSTTTSKMAGSFVFKFPGSIPPWILDLLIKQHPDNFSIGLPDPIPSFLPYAFITFDVTQTNSLLQLLLPNTVYIGIGTINVNNLTIGQLPPLSVSALGVTIIKVLQVKACSYLNVLIDFIVPDAIFSLMKLTLVPNPNQPDGLAEALDLMKTKNGNPTMHSVINDQCKFPF